MKEGPNPPATIHDLADSYTGYLHDLLLTLDQVPTLEEDLAGSRTMRARDVQNQVAAGLRRLLDRQRRIELLKDEVFVRGESPTRDFLQAQRWSSFFFDALEGNDEENIATASTIALMYLWKLAVWDQEVAAEFAETEIVTDRARLGNKLGKESRARNNEQFEKSFGPLWVKEYRKQLGPHEFKKSKAAKTVAKLFRDQFGDSRFNQARITKYSLGWAFTMTPDSSGFHACWQALQKSRRMSELVVQLN